MQQDSTNPTNDDFPAGRSADRQQPQVVPPKRTVSLRPTALAGLCLALVIAPFAAGMHYQKSKDVTTTQAGGTQQTGQFGGRMGQRMGGLGTVTAVSSTSITITQRSFGPNSNSSGTPKTYSITSSTAITDGGSTASASDIQDGDTVIIRTASSTSTTATSIVINPSMGGGPTSQATPDSTGTSDTNSSTESGASSI